MVTVYTAFSTANDQFKTEFPVYYDGVEHQVQVCENCKELGLVLMLGCHVPDGAETTSFTCGFIDAPRFEMESLTFNDESRVPSRGICRWRPGSGCLTSRCSAMLGTT